MRCIDFHKYSAINLKELDLSSQRVAPKLKMGHTEEGNSPYSYDAEASPNGSQHQLIVKPLKSWKGYIWDTWELLKDQRWLLFKLDAFVLTFASVSICVSLGKIQLLMKLPRLATSSRTSICKMSIMHSLAAWKRTSRFMEPTCYKHLDLHGGICHWADSI